MTETPMQPRLPFLVMNQYYACSFGDKKSWSGCVSGKAFDNGTFFKDAFIYDADCRKFPVIGAEKLGWCVHSDFLFGLENVWRTPDRRMYKFRFLVGGPIQMTFEEVKKEVLDHMIQTGLYKGGDGGPGTYREKRENLKNVEEFYRKGTSKGLSRTLPF